MGLQDKTLEEILDTLPDKIADALLEWRRSSLNREKFEALLYASIKGKDDGKTASEIKAMINADQGRYDMVLAEIKAEAEYNRLYERLMCQKKIAQLRVTI